MLVFALLSFTDRTVDCNDSIVLFLSCNNTSVAILFCYNYHVSIFMNILQCVSLIEVLVSFYSALLLHCLGQQPYLNAFHPSML
jgi:hypothetical protein